jgi:RNA polymerase sigma-70 factor (ECF subfamily)
VRVRDEAEDEFREFVAARSPALLRTAYLLVGGDWALAACCRPRW